MMMVYINEMRHWILIATVMIIGGGGLVWAAVQEPAPQQFEADLIGEVEFELPLLGFASVEGDYEWQFPADFGPHPAFQREQWRLQTVGDCEIPFVITFERFSILAEVITLARTSEWAFRAVYTAELTIDEAEQQRASRSALDLAGANAVAVWVDDWRLDWENGQLSAADLNIRFTLDEPSTPGMLENWYSYDRSGRTQNNCEVRLTHRFTT